MIAKMTLLKAILAVWCIGFAATDAHATAWTFQLNGNKTDSLSCDTCSVAPNTINVVDSNVIDTFETVGLRPPLILLKDSFYKSRYQANTLLDKIVGNEGEGFDELYGTRNLRPILHGVAYRGGGNNYYHKTAKRHNNNPLPDDGVRNLCEEGFSASVYLYRRNWDSAPKIDTCDCISGGDNVIDYHQLDYFDDVHIKEMLSLVHNSITNDSVGPVYLHCWNGWHASGLISAIILRQYCGTSGQDAVNYWDLGTDGNNRSPRYQKQRDRIKQFVPFPEFAISDSLSDCMCPEMPTDIDSSQLHIDLDHLIIVPEALSIGQTIVCSNVKFSPGSSSFSSSTQAKKDLDRIIKAMELHPSLEVEIGGHTDKSGSSSANYTISVKRAKAVYSYLVKNGVAESRLKYKGYGQNNPIVSNKYKSTRALNRRIEVKLLAKGNEDLTSLVDESKIGVGDETPTTTTATETPEEKKPEETTTTTTTANTAPEIKLTVYNLEKHGELYKSGEKLLMRTLKFDPYSSKIKDRKNKDLVALLKGLKANPQLKVEIGGHTDNSGDKAQNRDISRKRAKAVYKYLIDNGISADRLTYKGYGSSKPRYSNKYKSTRAKNRRIEVIIK